MQGWARQCCVVPCHAMLQDATPQRLSELDVGDLYGVRSIVNSVGQHGFERALGFLDVPKVCLLQCLLHLTLFLIPSSLGRSTWALPAGRDVETRLPTSFGTTAWWDAC